MRSIIYSRLHIVLGCDILRDTKIERALSKIIKEA